MKKKTKRLYLVVDTDADGNVATCARDNVGEVYSSRRLAAALLRSIRESVQCDPCCVIIPIDIPVTPPRTK